MNIKNNIKDILYNNLTKILDHNLPFFKHPISYFSNPLSGDYGCSVFEEDKDIFEYEIENFISYYWICQYLLNPSAYPLPNEFNIEEFSKALVYNKISEYVSTDDCNKIMRKYKQFDIAYSINSNSNDSKIFLQDDQKFIYIHCFGS